MMINIDPIPLFDGDCDAALAHSTHRHEPVAMRQHVHADDRGWSLMNLFQRVLSPEGQINYSEQHPGVVKAWHRHQHQTDFWLCLSGHLRVGVHRPSGHAGLDEQFWSAVIGDRMPLLVIIPPGLWHGAATVGSTTAGLLYYVTRAFDPSRPDEQRRPHDAMPGFPWSVQHR